MNTAPAGIGPGLTFGAVGLAASTASGPLPSAKPAVSLGDPQVCFWKPSALATKGLVAAGMSPFGQAVDRSQGPKNVAHGVILAMVIGVRVN
jgi:hypothetical protein